MYQCMVQSVFNDHEILKTRIKLIGYANYKAVCKLNKNCSRNDIYNEKMMSHYKCPIHDVLCVLYKLDQTVSQTTMAVLQSANRR